MPRCESTPIGLVSHSRYPIFRGSPAPKVRVLGEKVGVMVGVLVGGGGAVIVGVGVPVGMGVSVGGSGVSLAAGVSVGGRGSVAVGATGSPLSPAGAWQPEISRVPRRIIRKMDFIVFMLTLPTNRKSWPCSQRSFFI